MNGLRSRVALALFETANPKLRNPTLTQRLTLRRYRGASSAQICSSNTMPSSPISSAAEIMASFATFHEGIQIAWRTSSTTKHPHLLLPSLGRPSKAHSVRHGVTLRQGSLRFRLRIEAAMLVESVRMSPCCRSKSRDLRFSSSRSSNNVSAWPSISRSRKRDRIAHDFAKNGGRRGAHAPRR